MKNSERFLSAFNQIDHHIREIDDSDKYVSFSSNIKRLQYNHRVIGHYYKELKEYNDLRNAIVHERIDGRVIAEPNDYAVEEIEMIHAKLLSPKSILTICKHKVHQLKSSDKLTTALRLMKKHNISQIPIFDKEFVAMLNSDTISSWMSHSIKQDLISLSETLVSDVLTYKSDFRVTHFVSRDSSVHEILDLYKGNVNEPKQIDAIIITHSGKSSEKALSMITDYDIPLLLEHI